MERQSTFVNTDMIIFIDCSSTKDVSTTVLLKKKKNTQHHSVKAKIFVFSKHIKNMDDSNSIRQ